MASLNKLGNASIFCLTKLRNVHCRFHCHNVASKVVGKSNHLVLQPNKTLNCTRLIKNDILSVKQPLQTQFSTSPRRDVPPVLWMLVKPVAKIFAALTGRGLRKWWQSLPQNKRQYLKARMKQKWPMFALAGGGLVFTGFVYYEMHIQETPVTGRKRFLAVTHDQLIKVSSVEAQMYLDKFEGSLVPISRPVWKRVERIANHIIESNPIVKSMDVKKWKLTLIDDKTINAFIVPNGHIFVFLGLVEFVDNDDQLACVLGHEMAHALLSHGAEQISYAQFMDFIVIAIMAALWTIMPTDGIALVSQWFSNKIMQLMLHLPYSRKLEREADKVGLDLAARACYDVRGGSVFWQKMEIREKYLAEDETLPEWLSTHPASGNRVKYLDHLIPQALVTRDQCQCLRLPAQDPRDQYRVLEQELLNAAIAHRAGQNLHRVPVVPTSVV